MTDISQEERKYNADVLSILRDQSRSLGIIADSITAMGGIGGGSGGLTGGSIKSRAERDLRAPVLSHLRRVTYMDDKVADMVEKIDESFQDLSNSLNRSVGAFENVSAIANVGTISLSREIKKVVSEQQRWRSNLTKNIKAQSLLHAEFIQNIKHLSAVDISYVSDVVRGMANTLLETSDVGRGILERMKLIDKKTGKISDEFDLSEIAEARKILGDTMASTTEAIARIGLKPSDIAAMARGERKMPTELNDANADKFQEGLINTAAIMAMSSGRSTIDSIKVSMLDEEGNVIPNQMESLQLFKKIMNESGEEIGQTLKTAAEIMTELGGRILDDADLKNLTVEINDNMEALEHFRNSLDGTARTFSNGWDRFFYSLNKRGEYFWDKAFESVNNKVKEISNSINLSTVISKFKELGNSVMDFNATMIPATYLQTHTAIASLNMSVEDVTKLMGERRQELSIMGSDRFIKMADNAQLNLQSLGFSAERAKAALPAFIESASESGASIDKLNSNIDFTATQFGKIAAFTDITADAYAKLNTSLYQQDLVIQRSLGMRQEERATYKQGLVQLRDYYRTQGLQIDQAQELVRLQEEQRRQSVASRFKESSRALQMAALTGMSMEDAQRLRMLTLRRNLTTEEQNERSKLSAELERRMAVIERDADSIGISASASFQTIFDGYRSDAASISKEGLMRAEGTMRQDAGLAVSNLTEADRKRTEELARGSEGLAKFTTAIETVTAALKSPIVSTLAVTAAFLWLSKITIGVSTALTMFGSKLAALSASGNFGGGGLPGWGDDAGRPGKVPDGKGTGKLGKAPGRFGKIWSGTKKAGSAILSSNITKGVVKGGLAGAAVSVGISAAGAAAEHYAGEESTISKILNSKYLNAALTGATVGGTAGTVIPILGNGVGAIAGAAVGLVGAALYDIFSKEDSKSVKKTIEATDAVLAGTISTGVIASKNQQSQTDAVLAGTISTGGIASKIPTIASAKQVDTAPLQLTAATSLFEKEVVSNQLSANAEQLNSVSKVLKVSDEKVVMVLQEIASSLTDLSNIILAKTSTNQQQQQNILPPSIVRIPRSQIPSSDDYISGAQRIK